MKKKITSFMLLCAVVLFAIASPISANTINLSHEGSHHEHRLLKKEQLDQFINQGYKKKDIYKAAHIAKFSGKNIEEVLQYFKAHNNSWEETAKHYGVDLKKIHKHHKFKFLKEHPSEAIKTLSAYTGKQEQEIKSWINDGISLHFVVGAAAVAKLSGKPIDELIEMKKQGKSSAEIKEKYKLDESKVHQEIKNIMRQIKKNVKAAGQ